MLKGINPLLNADILHLLASMGHGDNLVICDANFPASSVAAQTTLGHHLEISTDAISALKAVLTLFPIDTFDLHIPPIRGMQIVDAPDEKPEIVIEAAPILQKLGSDISLIERHAFYDAAINSYAVIRTIETKFYGNFILRKGVVSSTG